MKKVYIVIVLLFVLKNIIAQNLEGIWEGKSQHRFGMISPKTMSLELFRINDTTYTGVIHLGYNKGFEHTKVTGKFYPKDSAFVLKEDSVVSYRKSFFEEIILGTNYLKLYKNDNSYKLKGNWKGPKEFLARRILIGVEFKKIILLDTIKHERIDDIQKVIDISRKDADSVIIELYDNGVVDGDSVTLYLNNSVIGKNIKLLSTPQSFIFSLNQNIQYNKLTLTADNLGTIPPNTGFLIIKTKNKTYRIFLSATLEKNATVEFQFSN